MTSGTLLSQLHIGSAFIALVLAAFVLLMPKGTHLHKRAGYIFAVALLAVNISAAFLYNLTGRFNFLHVFILISLCSLVYGMVPAIRRRPASWLRMHISGLTGAALGVWAAGLAELTIRVLPVLLTASQIIGVAVGIGIAFFFLIGLLISRFVKSIPQYPKS